LPSGRRTSGSRGEAAELAGDAITAQLEKCLPDILGSRAEVASLGLLAGGASKEAWAVDVSTPDGRLELLVRRDTGGAIYSDMLSIEEEYRVLRAAFEAQVKVPRPYGYLADLDGRDAFVMERVKGETIGRRIVRSAELRAAREALPGQMAQELARIHAIELKQVDFLPGPRTPPATPAYLDGMQEQLDTLPEAHPALELGIRWLREHAPPGHDLVLVHADFRLGNFILDERGMVAILDWEMAHRGEPTEDLGWPLVRAWRFGADNRRLAGVGDPEPYLERYNQLTGRDVSREELFYWELAGNVKWAIGSARQGLRHISGEERSVELAVLGRLASEVEYEVLSLLEQVA
jgi:aminoglycoside phosphotransferase (APT) family kinase protein